MTLPYYMETMGADRPKHIWPPPRIDSNQPIATNHCVSDKSCAQDLSAPRQKVIQEENAAQQDMLPNSSVHIFTQQKWTSI